MQIALTPKQVLLLNIVENTDFPFVLFGGARGGAKSFAVRELAIYFARKYRIPILILRKFHDDLLKNHVYPLLRYRPYLNNFFNKSELILFDENKNVLIKFDYAEKEEDIYKVAQGTEYPIIFVDEATQFPQTMLEYLKTANRDSLGLFPKREKLVFCGNPGGVGHSYIKRLFIDKTYQENEKSGEYSFIQSHVWDNVFWCLKELAKQGFTVDDYYYSWDEKKRIDFTLKYSTYAQTLSGLPEQLKMAYLYGDWNTFGGMFFKGFDTHQEVIEPFEIPEEWPLVGSLDPGFSSPLSYGLTTKDYDGNIYRIGTYYAIDKIPVHAKSIKIWLTNPNSPIYKFTKGRLPDYTVAGRDAFSKLDKNAIMSNEETIEKYFYSEDIPLIKGNDGPNTRIPNWWGWKSLIPYRYFIFRNCGNEPLISQITTVESDKRNPEDIQGGGNDPNVEDHALDEQKLGIAALITPKEKSDFNNRSVPYPHVHKQDKYYKPHDKSLKF